MAYNQTTRTFTSDMMTANVSSFSNGNLVTSSQTYKSGYSLASFAIPRMVAVYAGATGAFQGYGFVQFALSDTQFILYPMISASGLTHYFYNPVTDTTFGTLTNTQFLRFSISPEDYSTYVAPTSNNRNGVELEGRTLRISIDPASNTSSASIGAVSLNTATSTSAHDLVFYHSGDVHIEAGEHYGAVNPTYAIRVGAGVTAFGRPQDFQRNKAGDFCSMSMYYNGSTQSLLPLVGFNSTAAAIPNIHYTLCGVITSNRSGYAPLANNRGSNPGFPSNFGSITLMDTDVDVDLVGADSPVGYSATQRTAQKFRNVRGFTVTENSINNRFFGNVFGGIQGQATPVTGNPPLSLFGADAAITQAQAETFFIGSSGASQDLTVANTPQSIWRSGGTPSQYIRFLNTYSNDYRCNSGFFDTSSGADSRGVNTNANFQVWYAGTSSGIVAGSVVSSHYSNAAGGRVTPPQPDIGTWTGTANFGLTGLTIPGTTTSVGNDGQLEIFAQFMAKSQSGITGTFAANQVVNNAGTTTGTNNSRGFNYYNGGNESFSEGIRFGLFRYGYLPVIRDVPLQGAGGDGVVSAGPQHYALTGPEGLGGLSQVNDTYVTTSETNAAAQYASNPAIINVSGSAYDIRYQGATVTKDLNQLYSDLSYSKTQGAATGIGNTATRAATGRNHFANVPLRGLGVSGQGSVLNLRGNDITQAMTLNTGSNLSAINGTLDADWATGKTTNSTIDLENVTIGPGLLFLATNFDNPFHNGTFQLPNNTNFDVGCVLNVSDPNNNTTTIDMSEVQFLLDAAQTGRRIGIDVQWTDPNRFITLSVPRQVELDPNSWFAPAVGTVFGANGNVRFVSPVSNLVADTTNLPVGTGVSWYPDHLNTTTNTSNFTRVTASKDPITIPNVGGNTPEFILSHPEYGTTFVQYTVPDQGMDVNVTLPTPADQRTVVIPASAVDVTNRDIHIGSVRTGAGVAPRIVVEVNGMNYSNAGSQEQAQRIIANVRGTEGYHLALRQYSKLSTPANTIQYTNAGYTWDMFQFINRQAVDLRGGTYVLINEAGAAGGIDTEVQVLPGVYDTQIESATVPAFTPWAALTASKNLVTDQTQTGNLGRREIISETRTQAATFESVRSVVIQSQNEITNNDNANIRNLRGGLRTFGDQLTRNANQIGTRAFPSSGDPS